MPGQKHKYCMSLFKSNQNLTKPLVVDTTPRRTVKKQMKTKNTVGNKSKIHSYLTQSSQNKFNSPLSNFIQKHKEYRKRKEAQKNSVEISETYKNGSLYSHPFTQTIVLNSNEELLTNSKKAKTKRRTKYLTSKNQLIKKPTQ